MRFFFFATHNRRGQPNARFEVKPEHCERYKQMRSFGFVSTNTNANKTDNYPEQT